MDRPTPYSGLLAIRSTFSLMLGSRWISSTIRRISTSGFSSSIANCDAEKEIVESFGLRAGDCALSNFFDTVETLQEMVTNSKAYGAIECETVIPGDGFPPIAPRTCMEGGRRLFLRESSNLPCFSDVRRLAPIRVGRMFTQQLVRAIRR